MTMPGIDPLGAYGPDTPAPARMYDYMLDGKDNYPADRAAADHALSLFPELRTLARANRRFLTRTVAQAAEAGITQFLDLGSGLPTSPNVHETAQSVNPACRVVYVDVDPIVITHSQADRRHPQTGVVQADLLSPAAVLGSGAVRALIDREQPLGLLLVSVLHFCAGDLTDVLATYRKVLAPGSWLVISHATSDGTSGERIREIEEIYGAGPATPQARTTAEIRGLLGGWPLVPPGLADVRTWAGETVPAGELGMPAAAAVKPRS